MRIKKMGIILLSVFLILGFMELYFIFKQTGEDEGRNPIAPTCGNLQIYFLNVSQADATVIITPENKTILIDAGSNRKKNSSSNLIAFLKQKNIRKIDHIIATHYHEDHIGGMQKIFNEFEVGTVFENGNCGEYDSKTAKTFSAYSALKNYSTVKKDKNITIDPCLSETELIVAYDRAHGCWKSHAENDNSILLHLVYGNTSFLFTGDCEKNCEKELVKQNTELKADLLKVGHHGSDTSSGVEFLDVIDAEFFVISVDQKKSTKEGYKHPKNSTLDKLKKYSKNIHRTDIHGNILAVSDGQKITIKIANN